MSPSLPGRYNSVDIIDRSQGKGQNEEMASRISSRQPNRYTRGDLTSRYTRVPCNYRARLWGVLHVQQSPTRIGGVCIINERGTRRLALVPVKHHVSFSIDTVISNSAWAIHFSSYSTPRDTMVTFVVHGHVRSSGRNSCPIERV